VNTERGGGGGRGAGRGVSAREGCGGGAMTKMACRAHQVWSRHDTSLEETKAVCRRNATCAATSDSIHTPPVEGPASCGHGRGRCPPPGRFTPLRPHVMVVVIVVVMKWSSHPADELPCLGVDHHQVTRLHKARPQGPHPLHTRTTHLRTAGGGRRAVRATRQHHTCAPASPLWRGRGRVRRQKRRALIPKPYTLNPKP